MLPKAREQAKCLAVPPPSEEDAILEKCDCRGGRWVKAEEDRPGLEGTRAIESTHWPIALFGIRPPACLEWLNFLCFIF